MAQVLHQMSLLVSGNLLRNRYVAKQVVWKAFPDHDGEARRFIYRMREDEEHYPKAIVDIRSAWQPDASQVEAPVVDQFSIEPDFREGLYAFRVDACPTRWSYENGKRRIVIRDYDGQIEWLRRQTQPIGKLMSARVTNTEEISSTKEKRVNVRMVFATFQGFIDVTNPDALFDAYGNGIGRGRAWGAGMLSVRPCA